MSHLLPKYDKIEEKKLNYEKKRQIRNYFRQHNSYLIYGEYISAFQLQISIKKNKNQFYGIIWEAYYLPKPRPKKL